MTIRRDTLYNVLGQVIPLAVSLLTVPVFLRLIGEARFGALALVWLFFGYSGLFDLGVGQATARQLARSDRAKPEQEVQVLWTALLMSLALGMMGALLGSLLGLWYFGLHATVDNDLRNELLWALPWAPIVVPTVTVAGVLNGGLQARNAFAEINAVGVTTNVLVILAPLAVAMSGGVQLPGLVAAVAVARVLVLMLLLWRCSTHYRHQPPLKASREAGRELMSFGGWSTISAAVAPVLVVLDRFLIGSQLGAQAVSHYVVPFQLAERTTTLSAALGYALFPRIAACRLESDRQELAVQSLQSLVIWTSPPMAFGFLLAGPFLEWWISPEFALKSTAVAQILLLAFWLSGLAMVPYIKLLASGRPDLVARCHLLQLLPYVALLMVALDHWGLVGAALAFAARVIADFLLLSMWAGLAAPSLKFLALPGVLLLATLGVSCGPDLPGSWRWTLGIALSGMLLLWSLAQARQRMPFSGRSHL